MRGFNYKKSVQALTYFASKNGGLLNKMKAIKMIWLADRFHLRKYGRTITGDVYFALPFGPIPSTTRDILENNTMLCDVELEYSSEYISIIDKYTFKTIKETNFKVFSKTDLEALDKILNNYNKLEPFEISELSHSFPEWKKYDSALKQKRASRFEINFVDFFENVDDGTGLFIDNEDNIDIVKKIYEENSKILEIF